MTKLLDSRVMFWLIALLWVAMMPILAGMIIWHIAVTVPAEGRDIYKRQTRLIRDDAIIIHNQRMICEKLKVDCMDESLLQDPPP